MTTPTPAISTIAPDGAFTVGGGEWNFGQNMNEALGKSMFMLPDLTPENILTVLRLALERLPLDALKAFQPVLGLAEELFTNVGGAVAAIIDNLITKPLMVTLETLGEWITAILQTLFPWVPWAEIPENIENLLQWLSDSLHAIPFFGDFIEGAETFVQALVRNIVYWITHPGEILNAIIQAVKDALTNGGELLRKIIEGIIYWITHPGEPGGIGYLLMEALRGLFLNGGALINTVIESIIYWLTHPGQPGGIGYLLMEALKALFTGTGWLVDTVVSTISYWMGQAGQLLNSLITAVINWLKSVGIDLTGPISFMQLIIDNVARALGTAGETLGQWASGLVQATGLPALVQNIFTTIGSVFPVSWINTSERVNLLNMGVFQTSSTLENAGGWSWDSSKNRTGTTGGTAKLDVAGSSGIRTLYSNQNIRVAAGDRIAASAFINTSSFNGGTNTIQLVLIPFAGTTKQTEQVLAQATSSNNTWTEIHNANTPYEITGSTTSVQLALRVTAGTSGSVWWDDITLWKTGLMKQGLIEYLISAWNGLIGGLGVGPGQTAQPTNATDPWNFTLQAGASARGAANSAAGAAAAASGAAATADGKAVAAQGAAATADGKAVTADGKAVTADGKAVAAQGAANTADGKAAAADSKAIAADLFTTISSSSNNLVVSPDFDDTSIRRWTQPGFSWSYSTEAYRSSGTSLRIAMTQSMPNLQFILSPVTIDMINTEYPVIPGEVYKYNVWVLAKATNSSSGTFGINFNCRNINGQGFSETGKLVTPTKGTWQNVTGTFTVPATTGNPAAETFKMYPVFFVNTPAVNDVFYVDRAIIYRSA